MEIQPQSKRPNTRNKIPEKNVDKDPIQSDPVIGKRKKNAISLIPDSIETDEEMIEVSEISYSADSTPHWQKKYLEDWRDENLKNDRAISESDLIPVKSKDIQLKLFGNDDEANEIIFHLK